MKTNKELAVIFKKIVNINKEIEFIPVSIVEGTYCEEDKCFIDKDGTPYSNIIENPDSYGFSYRNTISNYKENYKHLSLSLIKFLSLREIKKCTYSYNIDGETLAPVILFGSKKGNDNSTILLDPDIKSYYEEKYPEFNKMYLEPKDEENKDENEEESLSIDELYKELTSKVIDQENAIKEILTLIWKQQESDNNLTKNILIEGSSKVGKSEIFKILEKKLNIPMTVISAKDYTIYQHKYKSIEEIILELITKSNYDIDKAQKGILIIDKFEEVLNDNIPVGVIDAFEKLLEGQNMFLTSNVGSFDFDTSKLMIIAINNTQKEKKERKNNIGFENVQKQNDYKYIIDKFSKIIKMNNLDYNSFIKILNSDTGALISNQKFLNSKGITLTVEEPVKKLIAEKAEKEISGVKSLNEIVERALSVAEFEIACNPNMYQELIITSETISDNKTYKLIKRNE